MRRLAALVLAALVLAAVSAGLPGSGAEADSTYRVDAIFDTSKGIIPGQLVKVAGARVGKVKDVKLTEDFRARIQMEVEQRFGPFRTDASCSIQPEGLLSENFVQCNPGSPDGDSLRAGEGEAPTVPVARNTTPVSLNDLFDIWNVPTRQRATILINELGIGTAGRGEDIDALLRRANPSLTLARRAITTVNRQRAQVASLVDDTDRIVTELAQRRGRVGDFVDQAARVTAQTADHSSALAEGIRRLPPLLAEARPSLQRLDELAAAGTPLLRSLRIAAPDVNRLIARIEPFAEAGVPAIRGLEPAFRSARRAVRRSRPLMAEIRRFTHQAIPLAPILSRLFVDTRDRGFVENGLKFMYYAAAAAARFDSTSHVLPAHTILNPCAEYARQPANGCGARYSGFAPRALSRTAPPPRAGAVTPGRAPAPAAAAPAPAAPGTPAPAAPAPKVPPSVQSILDDVLQSVTGPGDRNDQALGGLADYLLR